MWGGEDSRPYGGKNSYIHRPTGSYLVVVEQLVVGQASLLYNLVIGEVDFAEAVVDFHVEDVTGNVCDIAAEVSDNLAHLVRRCANDGRNLTVSVLAVFQRVQTIHVTGAAAPIAPPGSKALRSAALRPKSRSNTSTSAMG